MRILSNQEQQLITLQHTQQSWLIALTTELIYKHWLEACTRMVYLGENQRTITGRSMDWKVDLKTNLWIYPKGMKRHGQAGDNSIEWISKYGSVTAAGYDIATTDGVNEKGLSANLLWLVESEYPSFTEHSKPGLSIAAWAQYVLDNFPDVASAVAALKEEPFTLVTAGVPGEGRLATLHLSLSDASGDSAIVEYIDGKQVIHHSREYQVMTNSPTFDEQLALNAYWQQIGGTTMLPGTNRAADRFVRASFYINAIPKTGSPEESLAYVLSSLRSVSVPFGISTPNEPNISSTRWRTLVDHKNQLYFFESALSPSIFWVDLKAVDFSEETGKVRSLKLGPNQSRVLSGDVSEQFEEAEPFHFIGL